MARRLWARESQARLSWNSIEALRDTHKERERETRVHGGVDIPKTVELADLGAPLPQPRHSR